MLVGKNLNSCPDSDSDETLTLGRMVLLQSASNAIWDLGLLLFTHPFYYGSGPYTISYPFQYILLWKKRQSVWEKSFSSPFCRVVAIEQPAAKRVPVPFFFTQHKRSNMNLDLCILTVENSMHCKLFYYWSYAVNQLNLSVRINFLIRVL